jgi:hypothetical protein
MQGDKGDTPHITFRYDEETGDLYYKSTGILMEKDYVSTYDLVDKSTLNEAMQSLTSSLSPSKSFVKILGGVNNWVEEDVYDNNGNVIGSRFGQTVNVNNAVITPFSQVDLQINSEQLVAFSEKDISFVAENEGGVITMYCLGSIPQNDYTIQVTVTEVVLDV